MLRREAPIHALMIVVMVAAMLSGTSAAMLLGSGAMVVTALGCAVLSRRSPHFAVQCLDLWAMALGMLALTIAPASSHHGSGAAGPALYAAVVAGWAVWRSVLLVVPSYGRAGDAARRRSRWYAGQGAVASVAITAAGLAIMPLLH